MTSVLIRAANADDLPALAQISAEAIATTTADWDFTPRSPEQHATWFEDRGRAGHPVLVAFEGDTLVGFASYGPFRSRDGYSLTVEHSVYVDPAAQARGTGTSLMNELIGRARDADLHAMVGALDADNEQSLRFHERLGFTVVGRLPQTGHKFGRWLDLVLVQLLLDDRSAPA